MYLDRQLALFDGKLHQHSLHFCASDPVYKILLYTFYNRFLQNFINCWVFYRNRSLFSAFSTQLLLQENRRIRAKVPSALQPLMVLHLDKIDRALEPGLTTLNWTSVTLTTYVDDVYRQFQTFELLVDRVTDLVDYRINAMLNDVSTTTLCELPTSEPWTIDHFLDVTMVCLCCSS